MAVLYRSNMLSRPFEEALRRRHIPHVVIGDLSFWQRQEIKDGMALLKLALMPDSQQSDESFRRVANVPARGLGATAMEKRSEEHTSELQSLMRISYADFCLKKKKSINTNHNTYNTTKP